MSWSITAVGTPEGVSKKLDEYGETLTGQSKTEFYEAKPHLQALIGLMLKQNVRINASGHATFENGVKTYGQCGVVIENFYGEWCG